MHLPSRGKDSDEYRRVVHGWDIAVATGHDYACAAGPLQAAYEFVQSAVARDPNGSPGLFGPPVAVPDSAPPLDRLLGLTGRDPAWRTWHDEGRG